MKTTPHSERRKYCDSEDDETSHFSTPTKRNRKREQYNNISKVQTESFVMKLFDRSLDLSKYTEKTPLYPICRAWIANQPRNPMLMSFKDIKEPPTRENNGADLLSRIQRGEHIIVTSMPAPLNIEVTTMSVKSDKKPDLEALDAAIKKETLNDAEGSDNEKNEDLEIARAKLLAENKEEWKNAKKRYRKHTLNCDKRYELNRLIIRKLFKSL